MCPIVSRTADFVKANYPVAYITSPDLCAVFPNASSCITPEGINFNSKFIPTTHFRNDIVALNLQFLFRVLTCFTKVCLVQQASFAPSPIPTLIVPIEVGLAVFEYHALAVVEVVSKTATVTAIDFIKLVMGNPSVIQLVHQY